MKTSPTSRRARLRSLKSVTALKTTTQKTLALLRKHESRNVTFMAAEDNWPIVWARARGVTVWDLEGRQYLDLTAAFGVAAAGHANPRVVRAGQRQMATLLHAMGDVHPHPWKAELAQQLSALTFGRWRQGGTGKTIFCNSGFEAVEAALKTALLVTDQPGIIAFTGAYHGLGYGALNATHREHFRRPFRTQLRTFGQFLPFPTADENRRLKSNHAPRLRRLEAAARDLFRRKRIGAILVEPIQARGGIRVPPPGFLPLLRRLCDDHGALLVLDEIYTGFGRTGSWFACEQAGVVPDLICLGKALTGGFPLSACVGSAEVMDRAWPPSTGEAIHTSTFLGHPVGCAMALENIRELHRLRLVPRTARLGRWLHEALAGLSRIPGKLRCQGRGVGLLAGIELRRPDGAPAGSEALAIIQRMQHRGFILLPEGEHGNVIGLTPPLTVTPAQLRRTLRALAEEIAACP